MTLNGTLASLCDAESQLTPRPQKNKKSVFFAGNFVTHRNNTIFICFSSPCVMFFNKKLALNESILATVAQIVLQFTSTFGRSERSNENASTV